MSVADDKPVYNGNPVHGYYMVWPSMCYILSQANIWLKWKPPLTEQMNKSVGGAVSNFVSSSHCWNLFTTQRTFVLHGCFQILQLRTEFIYVIQNGHKQPVGTIVALSCVEKSVTLGPGYSVSSNVPIMGRLSSRSNSCRGRSTADIWPRLCWTETK